jgi:hypothetical protein
MVLVRNRHMAFMTVIQSVAQNYATPGGPENSWRLCFELPFKKSRVGSDGSQPLAAHKLIRVEEGHAAPAADCCC